MIAAADDESGAVYRDPLPYLHHFNQELEELGHDAIFSETPSFQAACPTSKAFEAYDLKRSFDFRSWPVANDIPADFLPPDADVPESRIRVIGERDGKLLHACYEKVVDSIKSNSIADIARLAQYAGDNFRWRVTYRIHSWDHCTCENARLELISGPGYAELYHSECGRWRKSKVEGPIGDHVESLSLGMPDDNYNGYYPTIPGSDIAHLNEGAQGMDAHRGGKVLRGQPGLDNDGRVIEAAQDIRGGTEIRGGKAEYRERTKDLILWDAGSQRDISRIKQEKADKIKEQSRIKIEKKFKLAPRDLMDL